MEVKIDSRTFPKYPERISPTGDAVGKWGLIHRENAHMNNNVYSDNARRARALLAKTLASTPGDFDNIIQNRFAWDAVQTKAAVSAFTADDLHSTTSVSAEFLRHLARQSIVGRLLPNMLEVGFYQPINSPFTANAAWVPQKHAIPCTSSVLTNHSLESKKAATICVFTKEALAQENAEQAMIAAMAEAVTQVIDSQFLDHIATDAQGPAPITANADTMAASSDPAVDFKGLLQNFRNLRSSFLVMHPETAVRLSLTSVSGALPFMDVGAMGGTVCGLPVLTSQNCPLDSAGGTIALIDPSRVICAMGGIEVRRSEEGNLVMTDTIDSNGTPETVGLFQADAVALRAVARVNWELLDSGAVRVLTGCDW